jgi:hypothetical protein
MQFPTLVYRCPGAHHVKGGSYDYLGVKDQAAFDEAIKGGWFESLPVAIEKKYGVKQENSAPPPAPAPGELETLGDTTPPTRAELEQKAKELKISFKKNISDEELGKLIEKALGG